MRAARGSPPPGWPIEQRIHGRLAVPTTPLTPRPASPAEFFAFLRNAADRRGHPRSCFCAPSRTARPPTSPESRRPPAHTTWHAGAHLGPQFVLRLIVHKANSTEPASICKRCMSDWGEDGREGLGHLHDAWRFKTQGACRGLRVHCHAACMQSLRSRTGR